MHTRMECKNKQRTNRELTLVITNSRLTSYVLLRPTNALMNDYNVYKTLSQREK
jgi:hypothetical protein